MRARRLFRWAAWGGLAIVLLFAAGLVVLDTSWGRERVRRLLISQSAKYLAGRLEVASLSGSILRGPTLHGVTLVQDGRQVLAADEIRLRYRISGFTRGAIELDEVVLQAPVLAIVETPAGWNVAHMVAPRPGATPGHARPIMIHRVSVIDGRIQVAPADAAAHDLVSVGFDGDVSYQNSRLNLTSHQLQATDRTAGVVVRQLAASLVLDHDQLVIEGLELRTDAAHVTGFLRVTSRSQRPIVDADVAADPLSIPEIARYVPALRKSPLVAQVRVNARGPWDAVLASWQLRSPGGTVNGDGTFDLSRPVRTFRGTVDLTRFNLATFVSSPDLTTDVTGVVHVSGALPGGDWGHASFQYQIDARDASFHDYRASDVHAKGTYNSNGVTALGHGIAYGAAATFDLDWRAGPGTLTVTGDGKQLDLARLPADWGAPQFNTDIATHYQFLMDPHSWTADARLEDSIVEGAHLRAGTTGHVVSRAGDLTYKTAGHVSELDPDHMLKVLRLSKPSPHWQGRVEADFTLEAHGRAGAWMDHDAQASLAMTGSTVGGVQVEHLHATGSLSARALTADVSGRVHATPLVAGEHPRPTRVNGDLDAHLLWHDVSAPIAPASIDGTVNIDVSDSTVEGVVINRAHADASVEGGMVRVAAAEIDGPAIKATASGTVALVEPGQSELAYTIEAFDLATLSALVSQSVSGGAHLEGRIGGTRASTTVKGTLTAHTIRRDPVSAVALTGEYTVEVPDLALDRARLTASVEGTLLEAGRFKIDRFTATAKYAALIADVTTRIEQPDRTITAEAEVFMAADRREVHVRHFAMEREDIVWQLTSPEATVRYGSDLTISGLTLGSKEASLTVDGALPVKAAGAASASQVTITARAVPLADLDALFIKSNQLEGSVDGTTTVTGSLEAPHVVSDTKVTAGEAGGVPFEALAIKAEYAGRAVQLDARLHVDAASELTIAGTVPLDGAGLDLHASTTGIPAALLAPMLRSYVDQLQGALRCDVQVAGALQSPSVRGDVGIAGGQFRLVLTGADFRNVDAAVRFDGDRISVEQFFLEDGDGHRLTISGSSSGGGADRSFELNAQGSGIHLLRSDLGELALDIDIRGTGTTEAPRVEGTFGVERGRLEVDKILNRLWRNAYAPVSAETPAAAGATPAESPSTGFFSRVSVDIRLNVPDNLVLRGRDLRTSAVSAGLGNINLTAGGSLRATKDPGASTLFLGQISIARGHYDFQGRRFEIERGSQISLRGQETLDPILHVTATRQISGVTARVTIGGRLQQPEITLSSDPPLDPGDVLSLIVFNQSINELGGEQQASLAERAGQMAFGAVTTPLTDSIARALDLDLFEVRTGETADAGPVITVGRQISDKLFVGFRHEFGRDEASRVSFEYRLRSFMRLVTSVGQGTQNPSRVPRDEAYGLDLFFVIKR